MSCAVEAVAAGLICTCPRAIQSAAAAGGHATAAATGAANQSCAAQLLLTHSLTFPLCPSAFACRPCRAFPVLLPAEGVIKKVRFETFFAVRHFPTKQEGKRFELRVVTGRAMQLLAANPDEARRWVSTLRAVLGSSMAVLRIQAAFRGHRARKALKKMRAERAKAVALVAGGTGAGAGAAGALGGPGTRLSIGMGAGPHTVHGTIKSSAGIGMLTHKPAGGAKSGSKSPSGGAGAGGDDKPLDVTVTLRADGVLMEGELKKKNSNAANAAMFALAALFSVYRTRYFVLYTPDAALYYFDSKAQR